VPDPNKAESLFHQALAMPSELARLEWLAAQCVGEGGLFQEVSTLLEAWAQMAGASEAVRVPPPPSALFGAYRAVRLLGRGGMSAVYLAERADGQFQKTVALKVMAGYLADPEFFRRFEIERQFLAVLNHHNITRLLDGGVSSNGDPFLVTEYVDGQNIDRYCEERKLAVDERLRIFLQVCGAVEYAHRNLIVHRDLKPANILVNREGDVKLLDFGTASLSAGAQNSPTVTRMRMLTPRYASPEQLRGERVNIATDVFSLGVILYELLTGAWPFGDPNSMLREMDRCSGHITANPPSAAITEEAASARSGKREHLSRTLKGDLSAIILKTLEADPSRRYESVHALAADLEDFLAGRPVTARAQTAMYRAGKFLRRRWLPVGAGAVFVLGLAAAALVAGHQAQVARAEASKAEAEASKADMVNRFLNDMLSSAATGGFDPKTYTVAQMLEAAETRIEKNWSGDARTEATLRLNLGASYVSMTQFDRARPQLERALATFQALGDEKEVAWTLYILAELASSEGRAEQAAQQYEQVLEHLKRLGKEAPSMLKYTAEEHLAKALSTLNRRLPEALALIDDAIAVVNRDLSIPRVCLLIAVADRGLVLQSQGREEEAEAAYRKALAMGVQEDPSGLQRLAPLFGLATLMARKDPAAAAELSREAYELAAKMPGPDPGFTAIAKIQWVRLRADAGQPGDAVQDVLEAMKIVRQRHRPPSMDRWLALSSSAHVLNRAKRYHEAESLARELLPILEANHLPDNDGRRGESLLELGEALHGERKDREAAEVLRQAAAIYDASHGGAVPGMSKRIVALLHEIH
jgi:eukaryotic-like serine/threonine-protein kinase